MPSHSSSSKTPRQSAAAKRAPASSASSSGSALLPDASPVLRLEGGGTVRVGIGGWNFPEWRGLFYPDGLRQSDELAYASRRMTAIEINSTYYGTQKRESFANWAKATPDDFVFSLKASRFATNRRVLADAGESVERFLSSGIDELGPKLGPVLWEFARTKRFEPEDFEAFLKLLPRHIGKLPLRHVLDVRHPSFMVPEFLALARRYEMACVFTDEPELPSFADRTAGFVYARYMSARHDCETGYPEQDIDAFARRAHAWAKGQRPHDVPYVDTHDHAPAAAHCDVFIYMINGAKERAPAAAMALQERLGPRRP